MRVMRELERMAIMDGTGILAKEASDSTNDLVLDVAGNEYAERNPYTWIDDVSRSRYSLVHPTTGADQVQGFTLTSKVESTNVLTCSATMTAGAAGSYIVTDYGTSKWTTGGAISSPEFPGLLEHCDVAPVLEQGGGRGEAAKARQNPGRQRQAFRQPPSRRRT